MNQLPLILYVPGLLPKPDSVTHRAALLRCLLSGVSRIDKSIAADIEASAESFAIVSWTGDFYGEERDFSLDAAAVDAVIAQPQASQADKDEASALLRRLARRVFRLADRIPMLIPYMATERMQLHLRDLRRYLRNHNNAAQQTRQLLKDPLRAAQASQRPVLLIAHSMGSVIAYESLWQMSRVDREATQVDMLLTMGSPLGQRHLQRQIKGYSSIGAVRFPNNIRRWANLSAAGDLTALNPDLRKEFGAMLEHGLVDDIVDREIFNWFRYAGELNSHAEYGYLANPVTAEVVVGWWRALSSSRGSAE